MDWLYPILDMAVLETVVPEAAPFLWQLKSPAPDWFRWQTAESVSMEALAEEFAFLDFFVPEAFRLRETSGLQRVRSEIWTQVNAQGAENAFRAEMIFGPSTVLVIQQVNQDHAEIRTAHQWGRDWALASQRLDHRRENVEVMGRHKDEFLSSMSHELRTPLNSIVGFATLLGQRKGGELTERQAGFVNNIHTASRHLLALINELLDIAKIDAGRLELHSELFPAEDCVNEVLTVLMPQASVKSLQIKTVGAQLKVFCDRLRLKQILYNLLSNAIKFSPVGAQVTIAFEEKQNAVCMTVSDQGPGIAKAEQARIFEPFQSRNGRKEEGTGLGLAITRRLVEAHGGTITLESTPQQGSRFQMTLPRPGSSAVPSISAGGIAVIEGEPGTGLLIRSILEPEHQVTVYSSWESARQGFATAAPGLVFVDHHLADAESSEVLAQIRQQKSLTQMFVTVLTREPDEGPAGFDQVIHKPLGDGRAIEQCVEHAMKRRLETLPDAAIENTALETPKGVSV